MRKYFDLLFDRRMLITLLMGFSSGLPLALTGSTLKIRITQAGATLTMIGFFSIVSYPYAIKFLWAPFFDRYSPPTGRRRGWLFITQIGLMLSLVAFLEPAHALFAVACTAVVIAFFSASQDAVIDAFRRESLSEEQYAWGTSLYVQGYRVAMMVSGALALYLSDHMSWRDVYLIMAACGAVGLITTFFAEEPAAKLEPPVSIWQSYALPLKDMLLRPDILWILLFVFLYKFGEIGALEMTSPFYKALGFSNTEIGGVVKIVGFWAALAGSFLGGIGIIRLGLWRALALFGVFQIIAVLSFVVLNSLGHSLAGLTGVILLENLVVGMSTAAYLTYMAQQTNREFSATQFALLSGLTNTPKLIAGPLSGFVADQFGWATMFIMCAVLLGPGLLLLFKIRSTIHPVISSGDPQGVVKA
jgi:PAT family beta-lactamase induction signal transducer AmpG